MHEGAPAENKAGTPRPRTSGESRKAKSEGTIFIFIVFSHENNLLIYPTIDSDV
jgi:hypothetical protein